MQHKVLESGPSKYIYLQDSTYSRKSTFETAAMSYFVAINGGHGSPPVQDVTTGSAPAETFRSKHKSKCAIQAPTDSQLTLPSLVVTLAQNKVRTMAGRQKSSGLPPRGKRKKDYVFRYFDAEKLSNNTAADSPDSTGLETAVDETPPDEGLSSRGPIVGFWTDSPIQDVRQKHAVQGTIGGRDRLTLRVMSIDLAGNPIPDKTEGQGNCLIALKNVTLLDHLGGCHSKTIKEYIRRRVPHQKETEEERKANDKEAIESAVENTNHSYDGGGTIQVLQEGAHIAAETQIPSQDTPRRKLKRRKVSDTTSRKWSANSVITKINSLAQREVARAESSQSRTIRHTLNRERLHDIQRLDTVWKSQEAASLRAAQNEEGYKVHSHGIEYSWDNDGPFPGRFVAAGGVTKINGRHYAEYQVLVLIQ